MNLRELANVLGGEASAGRILCPGPGHSRNDRSLSVTPSTTAPDGFLVHSFAGDDWRECRDHVARHLGIDVRAPKRERVSIEAPKRLTPESDDWRRDLAREIAHKTVDPRGTLAEHYLATERSMPSILDDALALTLRFHPRCPFGKSETAPAVVALIRDLGSVLCACEALGDKNEIERRVLRDPRHVLAIQRIRLTPVGQKVERKTLGTMGDGGVVFLSSIWEPFYGCEGTISEGVETAIAMRVLGFPASLALCGASRFRTFDPPAHLARITISGERGDDASEAAWRTAGPRWARAGHTVHVWQPEPIAEDGTLLRDAQGRLPKDANDYLMALSRIRRATA